jgi:hypothetical protein
MNPLNASPPVGHYAPLSEYLDFIKPLRQYDTPDRKFGDFFDRLMEIASRGLCSIVVQDMHPEKSVAPSPASNPWFVRMMKAVIYNFDLSRTEGIIEHDKTCFAFSPV